MLMLIQCSSYS